MMLIPFTHSDLVNKAASWVSKRFEITIKEKSCGWEIPDVVGISLSKSIMVECKVSRSDFHADKNKFSRNKIDGHDKMLGNYRIYCCPAGLLTTDDIPDDWGLLEVFPSGFVKLRDNIFFGTGIYWHSLSGDGYRQERHLLFTSMRDSHLSDNKIITNWRY